MILAYFLSAQSSDSEKNSHFAVTVDPVVNSEEEEEEVAASTTTEALEDNNVVEEFPEQTSYSEDEDVRPRFAGTVKGNRISTLRY